MTRLVVGLLTLVGIDDGPQVDEMVVDGGHHRPLVHLRGGNSLVIRFALLVTYLSHEDHLLVQPMVHSQVAWVMTSQESEPVVWPADEARPAQGPDRAQDPSTFITSECQ